MARTARHPLTTGGRRGPRLNDLNPYSIDANGWCEATGTRAEDYDREGPPPDPRADVADDHEQRGRSTIERHLIALMKVAPIPVRVEKLFAHWMQHARREQVAPLFPTLRGSERRTALRREIGRVKVRSAAGQVVDLATKVRDCTVLTPLESQRILDVIVDLRHAW